MANEQQVAAERTVIRNPFSDDPNAGIIVAAGDPIPAGVGVISNTPNKVDAAGNYDEADAADKATNARPATIVVQQGAGPDDAILERVAANRNSWEQQSQLLGAPTDSPNLTTASSTTTPAPADTTAPSELTVAQLDETYGDVDGYPKSGSKADKVAFAEGQAA